METNRAKIVRRLERDGWTLVRSGSEHDIYARVDEPAPIVVPRHRELSLGVARQIHKRANWSVS
jgi:predicted RNA binding protein YcfA (HicA-like mRNA interferase family)